MKPLFLFSIFLCGALWLDPVWGQPLTPPIFAPESPLRSQFKLKFELYRMPAVPIGTDIYVLGGYGRTGRTEVIERIDTKTNTVSLVPAPVVQRGVHTAQAIADAIYIIGGAVRYEGFNDLSDKVERLDTRTLKVTTVGPLPEVLRYPASVVLGDKIYVVGGSGRNPERKCLNSLWIYDAKADTWTKGAPMRVARECDIAEADGTIYALGGFDGQNPLTTCEAYDIATDTWRDLPPMPTATSAHHLALVGDSIWAFGDSADMGRVMRLDLKTQAWQFLYMTGFESRRYAAVCTIGNQIYVIGGNLASIGSYLDTVQVFDATKLR